jgi:nitrogen fixation protein FixH
MASDLFTEDDESSLLSPSRGRDKRPYEITGGKVLTWMLAFFAVIIAVNAFMAHEAISTFSGVDTDSAYQAGRQFEREVAKANAQDARHWRVEANVTRAADGDVVLDVSARDAAGEPLHGMTATALFARPADRGLDRAVVVHEDAPGHFRSSADIGAGQWDLIIELSRAGDRVFRSKNRVVIR